MSKTSVLVECQGLSKSFGQHQALNEVSFTLDSPEPVALVGPNGAGKSTLFSILCGYQFADRGSVRVFGCTPGSAELKGKIGALPQDAVFDPDVAVIKQLTFFARLQGFSISEAQREGERVLESMGLLDKRLALPTELSHGMKKRLSIAQALIGSPKLVLLDEPTAGLDPENARAIRHCIRELQQHTHFIISSHNLSELEKLCSQVLFLEQGRLKSQQQLQQQAEGKLSLKLWRAHDQIAEDIQHITGVLAVRSHHEDLLIDYDPALNPTLDQQLLQLLAQQHIRYRQLSHGHSLEDQLFSHTAEASH